MTTGDHNNSSNLPVPSSTPPIATLGELTRFIADSPILPEERRPYVLSALKRARELLGPGSDVAADAKIVLQRLERFSPAMAGMTPASYANLKSRVRLAFRCAAPHLPAARSYVRLKGEWAALDEALPVRERRDLSRFLRFAQASGWAPGEIGQDHLNRFGEFLTQEVLLLDAAKRIRATARAWNRSATLTDWPLANLTAPPSKRQPYWVPFAELPETLQEEIEQHLMRLRSPDPFLGQAKPLATSTVEQIRMAFIQLASALVQSGKQLSDLTSLHALLSPEHVETSLRFFYERAGNRISYQVQMLAYRAFKFARGAGSFSEAELTRLQGFCERVRSAAPVRRVLAEKNRRLLDHMDDQAFVDRLLSLPAHLIQIAMDMSDGRLAATCARDAIAIELLLTCGLRAGNLASLTLGKSLRKFGQGAAARWVIDIPGEHVKNGEPLRFDLLPESARLLELFLDRWHGHWCGPATPWLFPTSQGKHIGPRVLSTCIANRTKRHLGVAVTSHQFRHLTAELYLRADPNGIGIVGQHLGHRDLNTTRRYYARPQSRIATRRYHEILTHRRDSAPRRKPRKPVSSHENENEL